MTIDDLCTAINQRKGLKDTDKGALIHISSMTENSICIIENEYGGHTQLIYGDNNTLINYLRTVDSNIPKMKESNLYDISKITLDNYLYYNNKELIEDTRTYTKRTSTKKLKPKLTEEERKAKIKEYQHKYYLEKTREKRKKAREVK